MSHYRPVHPRHRRRAVAAAVGAVSVLALTSGCGASDPKAATPDEVASTSPASPASPSGTVEPTESALPSPPVTEPAQDPTGAPTADDGVTGGSTGPGTAGGGACGRLPAAKVGERLGSKVTGSAMSGGGCEFNGPDASSTSATVVDRKYDGAPGMKTAKEEATSSVEGTPEDLSGIGQAAFVVTGTVFGGDQIQGAGAVRVGDRVVNVTVGQESGMSADQVRAKTIALLKLVTATFQSR